MKLNKLELPTKRLQISKTNASIVGIVAGAAFVSVFSLVSARVLWTQRGYQERVINKKEQARDQLMENVESVRKLANSYSSFVGASENVLGGNPAGNGDKDGDNARIILDALPSKYDFPALTSSLEKVLTERNFKVGSISGNDEEATRGQETSADKPQPVEIPFAISVSGSYSSIQDLVLTFERSIRPIQIKTIDFSGNNNTMQLTIDANTYFQPEKSLSIKQELVK